VRISIEDRIRWSGLLIVCGLLVLLVSLIWAHPLAFLAFLILGCPLVLGGVLLYLWTLAVKDGASRLSAIALLFLIPAIVSG
jgi:hypothetical protein